MFKKLPSSNTLFVIIGILSFGLAFFFDNGWFEDIPMLCFGIFILYSNVFVAKEDGYTFKEEVTPTFDQLGYEILNERSLNFLERMNIAPEVSISAVSVNGIPTHSPKYLRKYHSVFTVKTKDNEILDVLTEITQHLDKEITVEILGTKTIQNT